MAHQLGVPENKVAAELSRFAEEGLLTTISFAQWDRRKLYERNARGTTYWTLGYELLERAAAEEASRVGISTDAAMQVYLAEIGLARASERAETEQ
jgi:hypothetical protein